MKHRYKKIVFARANGETIEANAKGGNIYEFSEGANGELIIRIIDFTMANVYSQNYVKPPIPAGYEHIAGEWNNGFVIARCSDGSQFVWIPVGSLDSDGTLDGESFNEKFGRRKYRGEEFSENAFHEAFDDELTLQLESIKKFGGFYISRFNISKNEETEKAQSVKGQIPWVDINFNDAKEIAATFEKSEGVRSHLPFGAEYDSVLAWLIKSKARTIKEIAEDSTNWGNHWNKENSERKIAKTGSCVEFCCNNIYDFAGNVDEWTQEKNSNLLCVLRGGVFGSSGDCYPVSYRGCFYAGDYYFDAGFRVSLTLDPAKSF